MTMVPAVVPRQYATQSAQNVGVRIITEAWTSAPPRAAARAFDGSHPGGAYPGGGFCSRYAPTIVITRNTSDSI